jgi:hypothetical protein
MSTRYLALGALIAAMAALGVGCEKEGPAEESGAAMDNAMDKAGDKMEQSAQEVEEAAEEAKDSMDETMTPPDAAPSEGAAPPAGSTTAPQ